MPHQEKQIQASILFTNFGMFRYNNSYTHERMTEVIMNGLKRYI